jgi:hypothetical protein
MSRLVSGGVLAGVARFVACLPACLSSLSAALVCVLFRFRRLCDPLPPIGRSDGTTPALIIGGPYHQALGHRDGYRGCG